MATSLVHRSMANFLQSFVRDCALSISSAQATCTWGFWWHFVFVRINACARWKVWSRYIFGTCVIPTKKGLESKKMNRQRRLRALRTPFSSLYNILVFSCPWTYFPVNVPSVLLSRKHLCLQQVDLFLRIRVWQYVPGLSPLSQLILL